MEASRNGDAFVARCVSSSDLSEIRDGSADAREKDLSNERLASVVRGFLAAFPSSKDSVHVALAPGRVNLIGEHIDYEGYSVLPMAIAQTMAVALSTSSCSSSCDGLAMRIANTNPSYPTVSISLSMNRLASIRGQPALLFQALNENLEQSSRWSRYVLCGLLAVVEHDPSLLSPPLALDVVVDGTVPPACGLSSSSALVVASALAFASSLSKDAIPTRTQLAERCRYAEHYVGTAGGGMDQAVSCLASRDAALFVTFEPHLHVEHVAFPVEFQEKKAVFMVVNSGVEAHKAQDAVARFNKRVVECALATKLLAKRLGMDGWESMTKLVELHRALDIARGESFSFRQLLSEVDGIRDRDEFSKEDLVKEVGPLSSLFAGSRLEKAAMLVIESQSSFRLWQRAHHVWSEAERVHRFRDVLSSEEADSQQLEKLGKLMLASHESCRDQYECSCPELDAIVDVATQNGAYGARLTGAGWGGCAVLLVPSDRVASIRSALQANGFKSSPTTESIFESAAADGAKLYQITI